MHRTEIVNGIRKELRLLPPEFSAILYGSEARGEAHSDSDVDLLIIVDRNAITESERQRIIKPLFDIEYETGVLINPIVVLKKQWEKVVTPFYENVMKEGIAL
jgi:predicted nucleotidyltransferase